MTPRRPPRRSKHVRSTRMSLKIRFTTSTLRNGLCLAVLAMTALGISLERVYAQADSESAAASRNHRSFDDRIRDHAIDAVMEGRKTFRFDTFGDEEFWGGQLRLHHAIQGSRFGGVGAGVSPNAALTLGLK